MNPRARRLRTISTLAATTWLVALVNQGCSSPTPDTGQVVQSNLARETTPAVSADDSSTLTLDNLGFAVDLYRTLGASAGNMIFSPASISTALAMAYGGASTTTATQIATTLHFSLPPERLHPAFDALDLALTTPPAGNSSKAFRLKITNATWGQRGFPFLPPYLDLLAQDYGAGIRTLDFEGAPEPSRIAINHWVSAETEQRIPQLLPAGSIDAATRLVLTNAVFFHGDWLNPFDPMSPMETFHADGGDVSVAMMSNDKPAEVSSGPGWMAAKLPYVGGTTSMVVVVPDEGTFSTFEASLTADGLTSILGAATVGRPVVLPRFKFSTATSLKAALSKMGMPDAFDVNADFSGIDGARDLQISDVIHQANIEVDEQGTTASAATAVVFRELAAIGDVLVVDRPFLFFIRHDSTGALLFAGRVTDPTK